MHSNQFLKIVAAALGVSLCLPAPGSTAPQPTMQDALARIEAYAPQALQEQGAPGMSVAITDRTHTLRILTVGYANLDAKTPVTESTRFPIGSITKGMTALALMEAHDEGRFDPSKPVKAYLPWFSINSGGQTIYAHQLSRTPAAHPMIFRSPRATCILLRICARRTRSFRRAPVGRIRMTGSLRRARSSRLSTGGLGAVAASARL